MKNLKIHRLVACEFAKLKDSRHICVEPNIEGLKLYFYQEGTVYKFCQRKNKVEHEYSLEHLYPADIPPLVGMAYVCLANNIYLTFQNGDIVALENEKFELIGDVASGLCAMEWSPDEELVVLVSRENKAIIMTSTFDVITEVDIHQDSFGEKSFVTVGWGKKETQFHGSEGKAAARAPINSQSTAVFDWDDRQARVRWRGDGTLFAVSSVHPQLGIRQIHIFNREGGLQSTSESVPGLEQALDWKPSGSLVASTQRLPNKHIVAFFEKNGLRHGELVLPFAANEIKVREVKWNCDSTVLAVWCEGLKDKDNLCCLQLWSSTNYHWHLKQTLNFHPSQRMLTFSWDKDRPTSLHVLQEDGKYLEYQWKWCVDHSFASNNQDVASVAVIDGAQVKISNFSESVIPPPMCAYSLKLPKSVSCVAFIAPAALQTSYQTCVILDDNSIALFSNTTGVEEMIKDLEVTAPELGTGFVEKGIKLVPQGLYQLEWCSKDVESQCFSSVSLGLHHWLWLQPTLLFCVATVPGFSSILLTVRLNDSKAVVSHGVAVPEPVLGLSFLPGSSNIAVFTEANYWQYDGSTKLELMKAQNGLFECAPARCQQYAVLDVEGDSFVVGLTAVGQLYINDCVALKNCTSFFVHPAFLLLTTHQHLLLCIPRNKKAFELLVQQGAAGVAGTERQVERGARLVVAAPHIARVVLQMPRGNLEAVQPRSLALHIIKKLLDQTKYGEAFDLMRRQRINLNIFYDHNPEAFLSNINQFVEQIKNPTWLCLFISDLMEADVTETMYAGYYNRPVNTTQTNSTKLDIVCQQMRRVLNEVDKERMLLPIITTYIKQSTSDIGEALKCIRNTKVLEQQGSKLSVSSDEALNYLFYIVDVYELFDVALGLYDFDLVMMVAAKSQKDPKEYIPFLNELRKLEENYRKFTIDKHLKKFESALNHLSKCSDSHAEECLDFMKAHNLFTAALKIFPRSHNLYEQVCQSYAEHLLTERKYEDAGIMFSRSNCHGPAIDAYKKAGAWKTVLALVPTLQLSDDELSSFYKELAHDLREHKQFIEAAVVFGEYLHDAEERVVSLCMARSWDEALRIISLHNLPALKDSLVRPGVVDHFESLTVQLTSWQDQLQVQTTRLSKVREEKTRRLEEEGDEMLALPECDMFSDTSSIQGSSRSSSASSSRTGKTYRSSKNKRKHERKLLSLKEGSPYEDLALVRALHELFTKAHHLRGELHSLCISLLHFGMDARAAELQTKLSNLLVDMERKQSDIWIPELAQNRAAALKHMGPESTSNSLAAIGQSNPSVLTAAAELEPHLCLPPTLARTSWKLGFLA